MKKDDVAEAVATPTFNVGNMELAINPSKNQFVPSSGDILGNHKELETIALGVRDNLPVLLIGDTGTGKTSFIRFLANKTNNGFRRLNLNGSTSPDELVGHYAPTGSGISWVDGVLTEAMRRGDWILLDELNAAIPDTLFALQSVLDDDHMLVLAEKDGEIVRPHENFRVFATMNPSLEYAGTRDLNKALLSRFPIVIQTQYPDAVHEIAIIKNHVPGISDKDANVMVRVAEDIRKGKKQNTIGFICSTRELINWAKLTPSVGLKQAAELAVLNKCELDTDKKTIEDIFSMTFGKWEKNKILTLSEIESQLEQAKQDVKKIVDGQKDNLALIKAQEQELESYRKVMGMAAAANKASVLTAGADVSMAV